MIFYTSKERRKKIRVVAYLCLCLCCREEYELLAGEEDRKDHGVFVEPSESAAERARRRRLGNVGCTPSLPAAPRQLADHLVHGLLLDCASDLAHAQLGWLMRCWPSAQSWRHVTKTSFRDWPLVCHLVVTKLLTRGFSVSRACAILLGNPRRVRRFVLYHRGYCEHHLAARVLGGVPAGERAEAAARAPVFDGPFSVM